MQILTINLNFITRRLPVYYHYLYIIIFLCVEKLQVTPDSSLLYTVRWMGFLFLYICSGKIPEWLKGSLIRVGPGKFEEEDFAFNHWQDGMAVMYKFSIAPNGKARHIL